jgi:hypothetical protein
MRMRTHRISARVLLAAIVVVHLGISMVHGMAHDGAHIALSRVATLFVFGVILAGPLVGLALSWPAPRIGFQVVAVTMAASFVFGLVNHFMLVSPDHVSQVAHDWRPLFTATAVLLALTEAIGAALAWRAARSAQPGRTAVRAA